MSVLSSPAFWVRFFGEFRCHQCGSREGYVLRPRNLFEKYGLPWLFFRTARCGDCYRRSYRPLRVPLAPRPKPLNFDGEHMLAATLLAERKVPQRETSAKDTKRERIA
jgi:hypothetical protein